MLDPAQSPAACVTSSRAMTNRRATGGAEANLSWNVLRDALDRWQRREAPTATVE